MPRCPSAADAGFGRVELRSRQCPAGRRGRGRCGGCGAAGGGHRPRRRPAGADPPPINLCTGRSSRSRPRSNGDHAGLAARDCAGAATAGAHGQAGAGGHIWRQVPGGSGRQARAMGGQHRRRRRARRCHQGLPATGPSLSPGTDTVRGFVHIRRRVASPASARPSVRATVASGTGSAAGTAGAAGAAPDVAPTRSTAMPPGTAGGAAPVAEAPAARSPGHPRTRRRGDRGPIATCVQRRGRLRRHAGPRAGGGGVVARGSPCRRRRRRRARSVYNACGKRSR